MKNKNGNHGGFREGAGRPASDFTERVTIKVSPQMKQKIIETAVKSEKSISELIRDVFEKAFTSQGE